jgi:hypothetical protein
MDKPLVAVDLDGTVGDPYAWLPRVNEIFDLDLTPDNFHHLKIRNNEGCGHVPADFYVKNKPIFHEEIGLREGASEAIGRLQERFDLVFVTGRTDDMKELTEAWLAEHGVPTSLPVVYLGLGLKTVWTDQYKPAFFLEDNVEQSKAIAASGIPVIVMDASYNRGVEGENIYRAENWAEAEAILKKAI